MEVVNAIALGVAAAVFIAAIDVALYKWIFNTRANFSPRDEKK